jgi:hypothetical protein
MHAPPDRQAGCKGQYVIAGQRQAGGAFVRGNGAEHVDTLLALGTAHGGKDENKLRVWGIKDRSHRGKLLC